jgi:glycerate kinase
MSGNAVQEGKTCHLEQAHPLRIIVAPDSFKGSLSSVEAARAIEAGLRRAAPEASVTAVPMADGGEGTVEAVLAAAGGELRRLRVAGPLGEPVEAAYGLLPDGETAVIETASASGLTLVPPERRDPLATTTYGTGQLIFDALEQGAKRLYIGLGGSATNDGGMGLAQALGVRFLDAAGHVIEERGCGALLKRVERIDLTALDPRFASAEIVVLSDVTNPLCGPEGASFVYGPQKGASPETAALLDQGLAHYAGRMAAAVGRDVSGEPGAGAAGGLGAALIAFSRARMRRGIEVILELARFGEAAACADLVITGEGRTDAQTAYGKVPAGIAEAASRRGVPVICLSGGLGEGANRLHRLGVTALFSIANRPMTLEEAMRDSAELLAEAAENAVRLFLAGRGVKTSGSGSAGIDVTTSV